MLATGRGKGRSQAKGAVTEADQLQDASEETIEELRGHIDSANGMAAERILAMKQQVLQPPPAESSPSSSSSNADAARIETAQVALKGKGQKKPADQLQDASEETIEVEPEELPSSSSRRPPEPSVAPRKCPSVVPPRIAPQKTPVVVPPRMGPAVVKEIEAEETDARLKHSGVFQPMDTHMFENNKVKLLKRKLKTDMHQTSLQEKKKHRGLKDLATQIRWWDFYKWKCREVLELMTADEMRKASHKPWNATCKPDVADWLLVSQSQVDKERLKACGNIVIPQCAQLALQVIASAAT
eukprot:s2702_g5.t1